MAVILLYVDDMLVASNDMGKLDEIKNRLSGVFEMKDLGEPKQFLGMAIERNKEEKYIVMHQTIYTENVLERFNMKDCKPQDTPMITRRASNKTKKNKLEDAKDKTRVREAKKVPYKEAIGSLMYLANATRPDIAFAVNYLARKQLEPTEEDWLDVKRVFRYLRGTANRGLVLRGKIIAWRSHKQTYVTLSTCQAEYLAMSDACQELISLDKSIRHVVGMTFFPITIRCDNQSAGNCTKRDGSHKLKTFDESLEEIEKTLREREISGNRKHMADTHGDFVKQCVDQRKIRVQWIETRENLADIMTKLLLLETFKYLRDKIMN